MILLLCPQSGISTASNSSPVPASSGAGGAPSGAPDGRASSPPPLAAAGGAGPRCCDTGRPIFQDPITGQTVCSCQYELFSYQRLASAGVPLSVYSAPYTDAAAAAGMAAYFPALAGDQPPFYQNSVSFCFILHISYKIDVSKILLMIQMSRGSERVHLNKQLLISMKYEMKKVCLRFTWYCKYLMLKLYQST